MESNPWSNIWTCDNLNNNNCNLSTDNVGKLMCSDNGCEPSHNNKVAYVSMKPVNTLLSTSPSNLLQGKSLKKNKKYDSVSQQDNIVWPQERNDDKDEVRESKDLPYHQYALCGTTLNQLPSKSDENERVTSSDCVSYNRSYEGVECRHCDIIVGSRLALKKHITLSHPQEAHGHSSSNLRKNGSLFLQRVRYEREEYRCQQCPYTCTIEKAFQKHAKLHSLGMAVPIIKVSCVICGKDRPSEAEMNKHMRKHRDSRYFCCDICIFRTIQLKKLIQHRRIHTGEKPHLCPHCAYRSARRDNLRSHVRRVHKKENLYCDTFFPQNI